MLFAACAAQVPDSAHFLLAKLASQLRGGVPMSPDDQDRLGRLEPAFLRYLKGLELTVAKGLADPAQALAVMGHCFEASMSGSELDWLYLRVAATHYMAQQMYPLSTEELIPQRLFFYWDRNPPEEVHTNVARHSSQSGLEVVFYSREMGVAFLDRHYGRDCRLLFEGLRHPAEESDFLRYHLVHHFGGYYLDTDEALISPQRLRDMALGTEAIFFLSATGPVENALFGAVAGSKVIEEALRVLLHNCYAHAEDSIWQKTGPGVLTRALVRLYHRSFAGDARLPRFCIRPESDFGQVVGSLPMPYRADQRDWRLFERQAST